MSRLVHLRALTCMLAVAGFAVVAAAAALAGSDSTIQLIAMDADPAGNTATSLGHLDPCIRTEEGNEVTVDLVVDAVPDDRPFIGYQVEIDYDPNLLEVIAVDNDFLLGASGTFEPFEGLSDPLPDNDGKFTIIVVDLASGATPGANIETGKGVLSRVTFRAEAAGISTVAPGYDLPDVYPALIDLSNTAIEVRTIAGIKIAIGEDCPPGQDEIEPTELPSLPTLVPTLTSAATTTIAPTPIPTPVLSDSPIQLVAMDANPAGNTATSLGHLDPCIRAEPGSDVTVDLVVDAVPDDRPFVGYQVAIDYDPNLLEVIAEDHDFLLGASGTFEPFEGLGDPLPDRDGAFLIIAVDLGDSMESGPGVLSRLTLRAKSAGVSRVAPGFDPPDVYPALIDWNNTPIEVRTIAGIKVAIGQDCPPGQTEIQPTPLPPLSSLEATPTPTPTPSSAPTATPPALPAAFPPTGGRPPNGSQVPLALSILLFGAITGIAWISSRP